MSSQCATVFLDPPTYSWFLGDILALQQELGLLCPLCKAKKSKAAAGHLKPPVVQQAHRCAWFGISWVAEPSWPSPHAPFLHLHPLTSCWVEVWGSFCLSVLCQGLILHGTAHRGEHWSAPLPSHCTCRGGQSIAVHPYRAVRFALLFFEVLINDITVAADS